MSSYTRLTFEQRLTIEQGLHSGVNQSAIARKLGVHRSTVCNEVNRNGGRDYYSARHAQRKAEQNSKRNNVDFRCRAYRFPLDRGGIYSKDELDFSKPTPRKWRFRKYQPKVRRDQTAYAYKKRWLAMRRRAYYLHRRRRNHVMEGLARAHRSLSVFQSYGKHWICGFERGSCSVRYIRRYTVSHQGIIKLHYRNHGLFTEENDHRSVWRGHIRYQYQNPVRRRPRIRHESYFSNGKATENSARKSSYRKRTSAVQKELLQVFKATFCSLWHSSLMAEQGASVPVVLFSGSKHCFIKSSLNRAAKKEPPQKREALWA